MTYEREPPTCEGYCAQPEEPDGLQCDVCGEVRPLLSLGRAKFCCDCEPVLKAAVAAIRNAGPVNIAEVARTLRETRHNQE